MLSSAELRVRSHNFYSSFPFQHSLHCLSYGAQQHFFFQLPLPHTELTFYRMKFQKIYIYFFAFLSAKVTYLVAELADKSPPPPQNKLKTVSKFQLNVLVPSRSVELIHLSWSQFLLANSLCERAHLCTHARTYVDKVTYVHVRMHHLLIAAASFAGNERERLCVWCICRVAQECYTSVGQR